MNTPPTKVGVFKLRLEKLGKHNTQLLVGCVFSGTHIVLLQ